MQIRSGKTLDTDMMLKTYPKLCNFVYHPDDKDQQTTLRELEKEGWKLIETSQDYFKEEQNVSQLAASQHIAKLLKDKSISDIMKSQEKFTKELREVGDHLNENSKAHGYFGTLFHNEKLGISVLVNRGTRPNIFAALQGDLQADVGLISSTSAPFFDRAIEYANHCKEWVKTNGSELHFSGHSLGSASAHLQGLIHDATVFGIDGPFLTEKFVHHFIPDKSIKDHDTHQFVTLLSTDNFFNRSGGNSYGTIIKVDPIKNSDHTPLQHLLNQMNKKMSPLSLLTPGASLFVKTLAESDNFLRSHKLTKIQREIEAGRVDDKLKEPRTAETIVPAPAIKLKESEGEQKPHIPTYEEIKREVKIDEFVKFPEHFLKKEDIDLTKYSIVDKEGRSGVSVPINKNTAFSITASPTSALVDLSVKWGGSTKKTEDIAGSAAAGISALGMGASLAASLGTAAIGAAIAAGVDYANDKSDEHDHRKYLSHFKKEKGYSKKDHQFNVDVLKRNEVKLQSGEIYSETSLLQIKNDIEHFKKKADKADSRKRYARKNHIKKGDHTAAVFKAERDWDREQINKLTQLHKQVEGELQQRQEQQIIAAQNLKKIEEKKAALLIQRDASIARIEEYGNTDYSKLPSLIDRQKELVKELASHPDDLILKAEKDGLLSIIKSKIAHMPIDYKDEASVQPVLDNIDKLLILNTEDPALIELQSKVKINLKDTQERLAFHAKRNACIERINEYEKTDITLLSSLVEKQQALTKEWESHSDDLLLKAEKDELLEIIKSKITHMPIDYKDEASVHHVLDHVDKLLSLNTEDPILSELQSKIEINLKDTQEMLVELEVKKVAIHHINEIVHYLHLNKQKEGYECATHFAEKNANFIHSDVYLQAIHGFYTQLLNKLDFDGAMKIAEEYRLAVKKNPLAPVESHEKIEPSLVPQEEKQAILKQLATDDFTTNIKLQYHDIILYNIIGIIFNTIAKSAIKHSNGVTKDLLQLSDETHKLSKHIFPMLAQLIYEHPYTHDEQRLVWQQFIANYKDLNLKNGLLPFFYTSSHLLYNMTDSKIIPSILKQLFPKQNVNIDYFFEHVAPIAQISQVVASSALSISKLRTTGMQDLTYENVLPWTTILGSGLFSVFEKWYQYYYDQVPESSAYYMMKDNLIELITLIPFVAYAFKKPEQQRDYQWKLSTLNLELMSLGQAATALYRLYDTDHLSAANKAVLHNLLHLYENNKHSELRIKLDSLLYIQESYHDTDDAIIRAIKIFNYHYQLNQLLNEEKYAEYLENTKISRINNQLIIGNINIPFKQLNIIDIITKRLYCLLQTQSDYTFDLIANINEMMKLDSMQLALKYETGADKNEIAHFLSTLLHLCHSMQTESAIRILDNIPWIKNPIHLEDTHSVKCMKTWYFTLQLTQLLHTNDLDQMARLTELKIVNGQCVLTADGKNLLLRDFANSTEMINIRIQLRLAGKISDTAWKHEAAMIKHFPLERLQTALPMHNWTTDEKYNHSLFYTTDTGLLTRKEEVDNLNAIFSSLKSKYPDVTVPEAKLTIDSLIHLHGVTDQSLSCLDFHKNEITTIHHALAKYHFRDLVLTKPDQILAIIQDMGILEKFNAQSDDLHSLKISTDLGKAVVQCLHELHHCSWFFSIMTDANKQALIKNIQYASDFLPAFQYLNHFLGQYLTQDIFDIIIKNPNHALPLAKVYFNICSGCPYMQKEAALTFIANCPAFSFPIIEALPDCLLLSNNLSALAAHAKDISILHDAIVLLSHEFLLTQDTFNQLLDHSQDAVKIANQIIEKQSSITTNPYLFTQKLKEANKKAVSSITVNEEPLCSVTNKQR